MNNTFYLFGQVQTSQTGGQLYGDTSPYGECSLAKVSESNLIFHWIWYLMMLKEALLSNLKPNIARGKNSVKLLTIRVKFVYKKLPNIVLSHIIFVWIFLCWNSVTGFICWIRSGTVISVTRFAKILLLWSNFKRFWENFKGLFSSWKNVWNLPLQGFLLLAQIFIVTNGQIIKNNLSI